MTLKHHFRMTASEIAMGRYMRAPDHPVADEFASSFAEFAKDEKPAAGAADDKGGADDGTGEPAPAAGPGGATGGAGDSGGADDKGAPAPAADDKGGAPAAADDKAPAAADDKGAAPAGGDKGGGAGGDDKDPAAVAAAAAAADDKGGKGKAPAAAAPAASESDDDVLKRLAAAVKKVGTDEPTPADTKVEDQPLFTKEEEAKIEHFKKEWPEVAEAFDLQARSLAQSVLKYAFEQIGGVVNPMRETLDILAQRTHYGDLKDKVGEYTPEERQEIIDWVDQQPTYLQAAMKSVIDGGTAEEVADLVGRFREATGKQPAGAPADTKEPSGGDVELSDAAKQAAAALAPVSSKRSAVQAPDDKSDFNGAFAKFADELG
jgi:hypothetical protein